MPPPANPCARAAATAAAAREKENGPPQGSQLTMGPQSQNRLTLKARTHQLQSQSHRKKGQQTLFGGLAFDPAKHCPKCRGGPASHKGHHEKCWNNPRKRNQSTAMTVEEKRLKALCETPLAEAEKCSGQHMTREATEAFFAPRENTMKTATASVATTTTTTTTTMTELEFTSAAHATSSREDVTAAHVDICTEVTKLVKDSAFVEFHETSRAPIAMLAFAKWQWKKSCSTARLTTTNILMA